MKQRIAIWLHGLAIQLHPEIVLAIHHIIREQTIAELAAQHEETVAQRAHEHQVAQRAARQ